MSIQSMSIVPYTPLCPMRGGLSDAESSFPAYKEITRRISEDELLEIERKMDCLSFEDRQRFLELVEAGDLSSIVEMIDYPLHALYAVKVGKITQEEFAAITFVYASPDVNKICIKMFDEKGRVNQQARDLIEQTFYSDSVNLMTRAECDSFFQEMSKLPPLQQQFFLEEARSSLVPGELEFFGTKIPYEKPTIRRAVELVYLGLNAFSKCIYENEAKFMIPSAGMMQTFLNIKFKKDAVRMNFVLGLSSIEDIRNNGLGSSRDVALRFPGVSLTDTADQFPAAFTDFTYHDWFHSFIASCASPELRKNTIAIADSIKRVANSVLTNHLIDLEMGGQFLLKFNLGESGSDYSKFLFELDQRLSNAVFFDFPLREDPSYRHRVFYQIAKELHQNLSEFKAYDQWGAEVSQTQIDKYSSTASQLEKTIQEIQKEIRGELLSWWEEIDDIENKELELEEGFSESKEYDSSNYVVLTSLKKEFLGSLHKYEQIGDAWILQKELRSQSPVLQILNIMKNTCFSETPSEICLSNNSTMSNRVIRSVEAPSLSEMTAVIPISVLAGVITLIFVRLMLRCSSK